MASLHPDNGARVVLERESGDGANARYRVTVYEPDEVSYDTVAELGEAVTIDDWSAEPAPWIAVFVERLLKSHAKKHAGGPWPRKITRWREER